MKTEKLEIKMLKNKINELRKRLLDGREYLMQIDPEKLDVNDCLKAFGFGEDGMKIHNIF
jgi:hypothetical protein